MKAIIFDFDGVLALTEPPRFAVMQRSAAKFGVTLADADFAKMVGRTTLKFLNEVVPEEQKQRIDQIIEEHNREYKGHVTHYVQPIPFSVHFVKTYHGPLVFALATVSARPVVEALVQHFDISDKFTSIICKEDVTAHKPDPEIYLKSAQKLGLPPAECIVIEDTAVGAQAARAAGMACYGLLNGYNAKEDFAGLSLAGFLASEADFTHLAATR